MRRLPLVLVVLLVGCGGGDKKPAAATPTPTVTAVSTPDPRHAIRAEIRAYRSLKPREVTNLFYKLDGLALRLGSKHFQASSRQIKEEERAYDALGSRRFDVVEARSERRQWATMAPAWARSIRKLRRVRARNPLARSARDFQVQEWQRSLGVMREFLHHLRSDPPGRTHDGYYQGRAYGQASRWPVVIAVPQVFQKRMIAALRRELRAPEPSVGDVYRRRILALYMSPLKKVEKRTQTAAAEQWMLFRLRELEHTPRDAYEDARMTLSLQDYDGANNPYDALMGPTTELLDAELSWRDSFAPLRAIRTWALGLLGRPTPTILIPTRNALVERMAALDLETPPEDDLDGITDAIDSLRARRHGLVGILRRGAKAVDSPRQLRRATARALAATRQ